ncbi:MAG: outer membrane beta-barrel protein [Muribaculaceae bacterium]|nr:outer membrane beta-barrel protein [Muribaculaceae bacterium]
MSRSLLFIAFLIFTSFCLNAADFRVEGKIMEEDNEPVSYATFKIYHSNDSVKPLYMGVSSADGGFSQILPSAGSYTLSLIATGKTSVKKTFEVTEEKPVADLGIIRMEDLSQELAEVTVTADRPLLSMEVDRFAYNVQADNDSQTSMTDEILRKVPLVTVEPDGTIKINGNSNFKIYKNGRPNNAFSNNAKDIFKSLPASMIEKIEVITEPGAREDAEGANVILNIITLKNTVMKGVMGNVRLGYTTPSSFPTPGLNLTAQYDKFTLSFYGGYSHINKKESRSHSSSLAHYYDTDTYLATENSGHNTSDFGYFGLETSLEPDTLNLFTLEFGGWLNGSKRFSEGLQSMTDNIGDVIYSYKERNQSFGAHYTSLNGSVNYQRSTSRKGENIILSYRIYTNSNTSENETDYYDMFNMPVPYSGIYTDAHEIGTEHTFQLDWTRPLNKFGTFDIGGKYIYRYNHARTARDYIDYTTEYTNFKHITQIGAVFADYRVNVKNFGFTAGLRYEFSRLEAKYPEGPELPFHANLNDWVPNAGVIFNLNKKNSFKLSWGSRIQRPGINYLNPAVNESPNYTSFGNPDLESIRRNSFTLNYNYFSPKVSLAISGNYTFSNNDIINIQYVEGDHNYSTYANSGKVRGVGGTAYFNWRPTGKTSFMVSYNVDYQSKENKLMDEKGSGTSMNVFFAFGQELPWKIDLSLRGNWYKAPGSGLYTWGRYSGWSNVLYWITLRKSFLKENRLSVSLSAMSPFHYKRPGWISYTQLDNFYSRSFTERFYVSNFSITLSYRFGSMNASVRKVRSIASDDIVGGNRQE